MADTGEPLPALRNDLRHIGEGFDVVDVGGLAKEPDLCREWRTEPGHRPLAFDSFHQRRFLTGHVGISGESDLYFVAEIGAHDVLAQESQFPGLFNRGAAPVDGAVMTVADEDVSLAGAGGIPGDDHSFHQATGVAF